MTLSFSTQWPKSMPAHLAGQPTYFPEKIWASIKTQPVTVELANFLHSKYSTGKSILEVKPKRHTIREDKKDRWKPENDIHFVINNRSKDRLQFAPVLKVKSIQKIEIFKVPNVYTPYTYKTKQNKTFQVVINGGCLNADKIDDLAKNDGFNLTEDFFAWFNQDFSGKIIHWTDLKY